MSPRSVFLDRDGTIMVECHYLSDPAKVELIPGVGPALRQLRQMGLGLVVVTNQSAIGRGLLSVQRLGEIHGRLERLLAMEGVQLDGIYYCPHAPADQCACRKPRPGLMEQAARELNLNLRTCFVIGDKRCDLELGRRVGAGTLLVRTGYGAQLEADCHGLADYAVEGLWAAVPVIKQWLERPRASTPV
ncbi:MAG: HAD family hydrolase [Candidatus Omnitrophica bacterium]|nr:HAD family hydrolase [Candidatus Omnitrophota bacterium]